jgi:hypothetical protein
MRDLVQREEAKRDRCCDPRQRCLEEQARKLAMNEVRS